MKSHRMPEIKEGGVNVTPLIDIVMCLIIFFMLVTKIGIDTGADKTIKIPPSILGIKIEDMGNTLTLNVSVPPASSDLNNAEPYVTALLPNKGGVEPLPLATKGPDGSVIGRPLSDALKYIRFGPELKKGGSRENPDFKVIIRGAQDVKYSMLEQVLEVCAEANVKNVNFETSTAE